MNTPIAENSFCLDPRLEKDCHRLGRVADIHLLQMNNGQLPWFVLVPEVTQTEFYLLEAPLQLELLRIVNVLSACLKTEYKADKLNVATIGNVVSQMHVHVVGRYQNDYCWPGVVWGVSQSQTCSAEVITKSRNVMHHLFGENFIPAS